ncbi:MAG: TetR/AcrR family transcriptional regulator [Chloroflexota bacterium]
MAIQQQKTTTKGKQTQETILNTAVKLASIEGLDGVTIGKLAAELSMSKSGLFGHFGSKEGLQLAIVESAKDTFVREVVTQLRKLPAGIDKVSALGESWLTYMDNDIFPGGCFFLAVSHEFDNKPGNVRDAIAQYMQMWLSYIEHTIMKAQNLGEIQPDVNPKQLAFELHSLYIGANWSKQMLQDLDSTNRARRAMRFLLDSVAVKLQK